MGAKEAKKEKKKGEKVSQLTFKLVPKLRLLLVMILIEEGGVNSLNRSKSEVKRNQSNRGLLSTLNKVENSFMSSMMILTFLSFSAATISTTSTLRRWFTYDVHFRKDVSFRLPEVAEVSVVDSRVVVSVKMGM